MTLFPKVPSIVLFLLSNILFVYRTESSTRIIDTRCESRGLYHLKASTHVGTVMDSPSLLHAGHFTLVKMQQLVPSLSKLSNFPCKLCHLVKHSHNAFPSSVLQHGSSPFVLIH